MRWNHLKNIVKEFRLMAGPQSEPNSGSPRISFEPNWYSTWGRPYPTELNPHQLLKTFQDLIWICSTKNSTAVASIPLRLYVARQESSKKQLSFCKDISKVQERYLLKNKGIMQIKSVQTAEKIEEVKEHPLLDLFRKPNDAQISSQFDLIELTELWQEVLGNCYWYIFKDPSTGLPGQIWILPSDRVTVIPDESKFLVGYTYLSYYGFKIGYNVDEIIQFKFPNIQNLYYGKSPAAAIIDYYGLNVKMNVFEKSMLDTGVNMSGVFMPKEGSIGEEEQKRLANELRQAYGGAKNAGNFFVSSDGLEFKQTSQNMKDMNYPKLRQEVKETICAAYGLPLTKIQPQQVRANSKSGDAEYLSDTIVPRQRRIEERINNELCPMYDDKIFVAFDNPLDTDEDQELKMYDTYVKDGVMTVNEVRGKLGLEPVPWGDVPPAPPTPFGAPPKDDSIPPTDKAVEEARIYLKALRQVIDEP
jgi:HK97 family phage portal protein